MKKLMLFLLCCAYMVTANAQDTVKRTTNIGNFYEKFTVLKADKKVRHGSYKLFYNDKVVTVGKYNQGKRTGVWLFYANDIVVQQYDYTTHKLIDNFPDKSKIVYDIPNVNPGDTVIYPAKIGGYTAGFKLMAAHTNYFNYIMGFSGDIKVDHLIYIDENGTMVSWLMKIKTDNSTSVKRVAFANVPEEEALFIPASVNGKTVASTMDFTEEIYTTTQTRQEIAIRKSSGSAPIGGSVTTIGRP